MKRAHIGWLVLLVLWLSMPSTAEAYIGPGAGITVIGTIVAFFAAIVFAIVGFIWYPVKRLRAALRAKRGNDGQRATSA
jgi:uncharacterized membrane protein